MKMFDEANIQTHIGDDLKYRDRLLALKEVEEYFRNKCEQNKIACSHDCTADEKTYYKTLNYTTYAGLFIMHPLSYAPTMFQMYDAMADKCSYAGYMNWIIENLKNQQQGKYLHADGTEFEQFNGEFTHVVVLPGGNKLWQHVSPKKLKRLNVKLGDKLVLKPHPVSNEEAEQQLKTIASKAQIANKYHDLYDLIIKSETVYTTHISETALTSLLLGKKISPIDSFHHRLIGSFSHINHFCFSYDDPVLLLDSIMASPKSGVVHPDVDENWQQKINQYFEYSLDMRELQKTHYYE